jgi:appr-1-p processing enzyme family
VSNLIEINKDITEVEEGVILQQVNCQNSMGAGVAKAIYTKYPIVKRKYHNLFKCYRKEELLGALQKIQINDKLFIFNSFSQFYYGNNKQVVYTGYDELFNNIQRTLEFAKYHNLNLYIPKYIGCGLANGDWNKVEHFISSLDSDKIIICYI